MKQRLNYNLSCRQGNVAVVSVFIMLALLAMISFSINMGNIANNLAHLQNAADSSAKAAAWKMLEYFDQDTAQSQAQQQAVKLVQATMDARGITDTMIPDTDLSFGRYEWNKTNNEFVVTWGATPSNLVQTRLSRTDPRRNSLDVLLKNMIGRETVELRARSNVALMPATGFVMPPGLNKRLEILPFALDIDTWIELEEGAFFDEYKVDMATGDVTAGSDGLREVKIFPVGLDKTLPSGNRGTLRLGADNNSTAKLSRQIEEGLNATDMSYYPNGFDVSEAGMLIPGDPGVSAGIEDSLIKILGQDRVLPLFTEVSGPGANCQYTIVKFVGVKVVAVRLRGALQHKEVMLQPSNFVVEGAVTNMKMPFNDLGSVFVSPMFINIQD